MQAPAALFFDRSENLEGLLNAVSKILGGREIGSQIFVE